MSLKNRLFTFLITVLIILFSGNAQLFLAYQNSVNYCGLTYQATFHPTDSDLVAVSCWLDSPYINLYKVSANTLNSIQNYTQTIAFSIAGLKFSPVNDTRAVASI
jgi:hypothetical protein